MWRQFGEKYLETVRTEVSLLAAIEDNLTETQRTKVRECGGSGPCREAIRGDNREAQSGNGQTRRSAERAAAGADISLTPEQEAAADKVQQKYFGHLRR